MKKLLLLFLVALSLNSVAGQFSVNAGYGLSSSYSVDSYNDTEDGAINAGLKYAFQATDAFAYGPYLDYIGETDILDTSATAISYGAFGRYSFDNGLYLTGSLGLSSVDFDESYLSTSNGFNTAFAIGYNVNSNIALEANYKAISYDVDVDLGDSGTVSTTGTFSTVLAGVVYNF